MQRRVDYAPATRRATEAVAKMPGAPAFSDAFRAKHLLGRFADPPEIVSPGLFLCLDASSYAIGHVPAMDGGYTAQ